MVRVGANLDDFWVPPHSKWPKIASSKTSSQACRWDLSSKKEQKVPASLVLAVFIGLCKRQAVPEILQESARDSTEIGSRSTPD